MSESVLSDGTVECFQRWQPGGAQGNLDQVFFDGDQYIFAVRMAGDFWEFHVVIARCDSEIPVSFDDPQGDCWGDWDWTDVEWFIPANSIDLPYLPEPVEPVEGGE
jgi:hypothetical protein